jgi:hypothetical protein
MFFLRKCSDPFSNRHLARSLGIPVGQSRKITYSLRKMGMIELVARKGNQMLLARSLP